MSEQDLGCAYLREALVEWLGAASVVVRDRNVPGMREFVVTTEGGVTRGEEVVRPDFFEFGLQNAEALSNLPEIDVVVEVARNHPRIGDVLLADVSGVRRPADNERLPLFLDHLLPFLAEFWGRAHRLPIEDDRAGAEQAFAQTFDLFAQSVYRFETIPVRWLFQFDNLRMEIDDFDIEPGIRLRRPTEQERNQAFQARFDSLPPGSFRRELVNVNPARLMDMRDARDIPDVLLEVAGHRQLPRSHLSGATAWNVVRRMLNALRLVQPNDVGIHSVWYVDENPFGRMPMPRQPWPDPIASSPQAAQTILTQDVERQVREIWPHLAVEQTDRTLVLALERLNSSYHRAKDEDRLIDYWVGLEALFLRIKEQELRLRAALLTAQFITEGRADRHRVFLDIRASYDLRSWVVHGAKLPDAEQIRTLTALTGDALRQTLRMCLADRRPPDPERIFRELLA
jgi:hypothetical protein